MVSMGTFVYLGSLAEEQVLRALFLLIMPVIHWEHGVFRTLHRCFFLDCRSSIDPKVVLIKVTTFPGFFVGDSIADMVDAFEGWHNLFIMGDNDDCRPEFSGHVIQNTDDR